MGGIFNSIYYFLSITFFAFVLKVAYIMLSIYFISLRTDEAIYQTKQCCF